MWKAFEGYKYANLLGFFTNKAAIDTDFDPEKVFCPFALAHFSLTTDYYEYYLLIFIVAQSGLTEQFREHCWQGYTLSVSRNKIIWLIFTSDRGLT